MMGTDEVFMLFNRFIGFALGAVGRAVCPGNFLQGRPEWSSRIVCALILGRGDSADGLFG